jgi:transposase InsO family protein
VDAIEERAAAEAHRWSAWGHRKIHAMLRADGVRVSPSSVKRALARRGLLQPVRYQAERRQLAKARHETFWAPPSRRNRVWQTDFTEFETTTHGTWRIAGVVDYFSKFCLAAPVSGTQTARDAINAIKTAIEVAEELLGTPLIQDCVDPATGEIHPVVIVSDNGPAYKSTDFLRFIRSHPELRHIRTRHRAPETNGVIERFYGSLKYEHLYREEIPDAQVLSEQVERFREIYNRIRPHEAIGFLTPAAVHQSEPNLFQAQSVQET